MNKSINKKKPSKTKSVKKYILLGSSSKKRGTSLKTNQIKRKRNLFLIIRKNKQFHFQGRNKG